MEGREILSDRQWARIAPYLSGIPTDPGRTAVNNRLFVDAVLWKVREGSHWRRLPTEYGRWNSIHRRFTRWSKEGLWYLIFRLLEDERSEFFIEYSRIVWAEQQASPFRKLMIAPLKYTFGIRNKPFLYGKILAREGDGDRLSCAFHSLPNDTSSYASDHRTFIAELLNG